MKCINRKLIISLVVIILIILISSTVSAATIRRANKIVNTTTSENLKFDGRSHESTIYAGKIKKDGVTVLNYIYSADVTRSSILFDNIRRALPNPYSDMVPVIIEEQTTDGVFEISTQTLNGVDLTTITTDWKDASNIASKICNGTNTDIVNSNMYDVDDEFKAGVDSNENERADLDDSIENNKRIISHLGTQTTDSVSFKVIEGQLVEVHDVNLIYLSEATTVIYTSVNVTSGDTNKYELGDVNKDGKVNSLDATLILKYVAKKKTLDAEQLKLADVTKDGKVNSLDAVKILKYVAKKITEF